MSTRSNIERSAFRVGSRSRSLVGLGRKHTWRGWEAERTSRSGRQLFVGMGRPGVVEDVQSVIVMDSDHSRSCC